MKIIQKMLDEIYKLEHEAIGHTKHIFMCNFIAQDYKKMGMGRIHLLKHLKYTIKIKITSCSLDIYIYIYMNFR